MHPVMSESGLFLAEHEGEARREAARKDRLVRDAVAQDTRRSLVARFAHAIRQFMDPRGYAMRALESAAAPAQAESPVTIEPVAETGPQLVVPAMGTVTALVGCHSGHRESKPAA